jgi:hypothetical protein
MADKIVGEYDIRVDKAIKELDKISKRVDKIEKDGKKSAKEVEGSYSKMANGLAADFKKLGQVIGVTFALDQVRRFAAESIRVAANLEGVERAFRRIGSPQILQGLRDATRGTVSDLQLMQNAVKASNFKIPLENLASLFQFAQARARETGESVDYLVDSIVTGIGRKSPLILDNLGISAVELRERLNGVGMETASVGDIAQIVGDIATEELSKMGDQADTTADKIAQMNVALENTKAIVGKELISEITKFSEELGITESKIQELTGGTEDFNIIGFFTGNVIKAILEPFRALNDIVNTGIDYYNSASDALSSLTDELQEAAYRLTLSNEELIEFNKLGETAKKIIVDQWLGLKDYADFSEDAAKATEMFNQQIAEQNELIGGEGGEGTVRSINQLNEELKTLKEQFNAAEIGGADFYRLADEIEAKIKEINLALRLLAERKYATQPDQEIDTIGDDLLETQELETDAIIDDYERRNKEIEKLIEQRNAFEKMKADERAEYEQQVALAIVQETLNTIGNISNIVSNAVQAQITNDLAEINRLYENGELTREEFERKQVELQRKSAQAAKDAALFNAIIGTSQAIINALSSPGVPFPVAAGFAALAAAQGAVQVAAIASEPLPTFAEGGMVAEHGLLKGKSHKQGGILIEAEGEEYFMPKDKTRKHYGLLEAIRQGAEEQYILKNYVPKLIDESMFNGFADMNKSAELNGISVDFKDHNLLHGLDRLRQSQQSGVMYLGSKLDKLTNINTRKGW